MSETLQASSRLGRAPHGSSITPRLGIIGGGQLAKMTALAGLRLGCEVVVLERHNYGPAAVLAAGSVVGDWNSVEALASLASRVDVVTLENEFIDAASLRELERMGTTLLPRARTLALVQDKLEQKRTLEKAGLSVAPYRDAPSLSAAVAAAADLGWPLLLKARRNAYDGKGNVTVRSPAELEAAWKRLDGERRGLYVEQHCAFACELAVIVTRARCGETVTYPVVRTVQRDHVCHVVEAPAAVPEDVAAVAESLARRAVEAIDGVGSLGVEMFLMSDGAVLINEMAPRVHNSGHYSIEACVTSQFENHVRAVLGWPLGSTAMVAPCAVMVNLLGEVEGPATAPGLPRALAVPGAHVHVYGKLTVRPGRKMGHVTALAPSLDEARSIAARAAGQIRFGLPAGDPS